MDKEDKQIIDRATKEEWRIGDRTRLKRLLKKNLKQYREKVELENKIADIKANCDLTIEGRDIKIMELEKENAELDCQKNRNKFCYSCANATERCFRNEIGCPCDNYKSYKDENAELESDFRICEKNADTYYDQLTKAKEIIKDLLKLPFANNEEVYADVGSHLDRAEQFLKEIEK